jgi:hypothetical protein
VRADRAAGQRRGQNDETGRATRLVGPPGRKAREEAEEGSEASVHRHLMVALGQRAEKENSGRTTAMPTISAMNSSE